MESLKKLPEHDILFQSPVNHDICRSQGNREREKKNDASHFHLSKFAGPRGLMH